MRLFPKNRLKRLFGWLRALPRALSGAVSEVSLFWALLQVDRHSIHVHASEIPSVLLEFHDRFLCKPMPPRFRGGVSKIHCFQVFFEGRSLNLGGENRHTINLGGVGLESPLSGTTSAK